MKIMSDGMGQTISCPAHECDALVDDVTVKKLLFDPEVRKKYLHLITKSFVEVWLVLITKLIEHFYNFSLGYSAIGTCSGVQAQAAAASFKSHTLHRVQ